ncbi:MAG: hypothetical protein AAF449_06425, partial [Myxococcota bacterium]
MTIERLLRRKQIWKPAETGRLKAPQKIAKGPSESVTKKSELSGFQKVAEGKRNTKTLASLENAPGPRSTKPAHLALDEANGWSTGQKSQIGAPVADEIRTSFDNERTGRVVAEAMDLAGLYDYPHQLTRHIRALQGRKGGVNFYQRSLDLLKGELGRIDAAIMRAEGASSPDAKLLAELKQLRALTASAQDVLLSVSLAKSKKASVAGEILSKITSMETALAAIDPANIGDRHYAAVVGGLSDLTMMMEAYPQLNDIKEVGTIEVFVMQTLEREEEIRRGLFKIKGEGPIRRRDNEPWSIAGALESFNNDRKDAVIFNMRFNRLTQMMADGQFPTLQSYQDAMLSQVPLTSTTFRKGVSELAAARWNIAGAETKVITADEHLERAAFAASLAQRDLQNTITELNIAGKRITFSEEALKSKNTQGAAQFVDAAMQAYEAANGSLHTYRVFLNGGQADVNHARKALKAADAYLKAADAYLTLAQAKGQGSSALSFQVDMASSRARQVRGYYSQLNEFAGKVDGRLEMLRGPSAELQKWAEGTLSQIERLDAGVDMAKLQDQVNRYLGDSTQLAHGMIRESFAGVKLSHEAKAYMQDPSSVHVDDIADVREELADVFRSRPDIAQKVADRLTEMKAGFEFQRASLVKQFGEDSPQVAALDTMEHAYLERWVQSEDIVLEALLKAKDDSVPAVSGVAQLSAWVTDARGRHSRNLLKDDVQSERIKNNFHGWFKEQDAFYGAYENARASYGEPTEVVPMALHLEDTGQFTTLNAYVFEDGGKHKALNPLTGRVYEGQTVDKALEALSKDTQLGEGTIRYLRGDTVIEKASTKPPEGSLAMDLVMGGAGVLGGIALFAPEPFLTKGASAFLLSASSAYFVGKGAMTLHDLVKHETFGNNMQTWGAFLDIASGVFMGLRGAGALAATARSQTQVTAHLMRIANSSALSYSDLATTIGGV